MDFLEKIISAKTKEVELLKQAAPYDDLKDKVKDLPAGRNFRDAIEGADCAIIAEIKKHSPLKGSLKEDADPVEIALLYENSGAAAVSVLTDRIFFHGASEYLSEIKKAVRIPVLRKDFIIDPYQIYESKLMGADALLLISSLLDEKMLLEYICIAMNLKMWPLVEVHTPTDIASAVSAGAEIIGINNRNLETFKTDIDTTKELAPLVPAGKTLVSESGIRTRKDVETLMQAGVHAFLIGEALMLSPDPGRKLRELLKGEERQ